MKNILNLIKTFSYKSIFIFIFYIILHYKAKIKIQKIRQPIIISLTASKEKMKSKTLEKLIKSLIDQTLIPDKILLSINKNDIIYISSYLLSLIKKSIIEVIFVKEDFEYFNKYYYIPDKYKKFIIIVFDDIATLEKNSIKNLFNSYLLHPNCISAIRVYKMKFNKQWILKPFKFWEKDYKKEKKPKFYLFSIHGEGALFPPNTLNFTDNFIHYFKKAINGHDFVIKYFELNKNLRTVYVTNNQQYHPLNIQIYQKYNRLLTITPNEIQLKEDFGKNFNLCIYNNIIKEKIKISNQTEKYFLNNINNNKITKDILLVSMTSYPARIHGTYEVFLSLLDQSANISSYQCFLTLSKEEFVDGEKNLPQNIKKLIEKGWVKLS